VITPTLQTDGQTTCDRNTALCTKVDRAVKMKVNEHSELDRELFN